MDLLAMNDQWSATMTSTPTMLTTSGFATCQHLLDNILRCARSIQAWHSSFEVMDDVFAICHLVEANEAVRAMNTETLFLRDPERLKDQAAELERQLLESTSLPTEATLRFIFKTTRIHLVQMLCHLACFEASWAIESGLSSIETPMETLQGF
jgi:hypothetical protein